MIKLANNLSVLIAKQAENSDYDWMADKKIMAPASAVLGTGLGAGIFHLMAPKDKKTLLNYLLASGAGGVAGAGLGIMGADAKDAFNNVAKEQAAGNTSGDPNVAVQQETDKARKAKP